MRRAARRASQALAEEDDLAGAVPRPWLGQQTCEMKESRRFAGAVGPDERNAFSRLDRERHIVECRNTVFEAKGHMAKLHGRRHDQPRARMAIAIRSERATLRTNETAMTDASVDQEEPGVTRNVRTARARRIRPSSSTRTNTYL
jgi:hypothetical protein